MICGKEDILGEEQTDKEGNQMTINNKGVLPAIGLGMVAGAALSMMVKPKQDLKEKAGKAAKAVGQVVEDIADVMHQ